MTEMQRILTEITRTPLSAPTPIGVTNGHDRRKKRHAARRKAGIAAKQKDPQEKKQKRDRFAQ